MITALLFTCATYWHSDAWPFKLARKVRMGMPRAWVILPSRMQWTKVLSSLTARRLMAARRSDSGMDVTSPWWFRIMSFMRSSSQQWKRTVLYMAGWMDIPVLYIDHCLLKADHLSGVVPALMWGSFSLMAELACGVGWFGAWASLAWSSRLCLLPLQTQVGNLGIPNCNWVRLCNNLQVITSGLDAVLSHFLHTVDNSFCDFCANVCYLLAISFIQLCDTLGILFIYSFL